MDALLDEAPCGYLMFDDDGRVLLINRTLLRWLGYEAEEVQGQPLGLLLPAGGRIFYQTHFFPLLKLHGRADELYFPLRARSGDEVPVLANAARQERAGSVVNEVVFIPVRQRARYEEEILLAKKAAEDANRLKDEFLAMVSHELRTPLTSILGWAQLLHKRKDNPEKIVQAAATIERNAKAQLQLIEDLLDVSRIILGKMRLDLRPTRLPEVIEAACESIRPAADAKGVSLHMELDRDLSEISADPARLQQVVWNLLANAVKFTPGGGRVEVSIGRVNSHVEVRVADSGIGIKPEFLPHVFDRFRQAGIGPGRRQEGLGLGLSLVRHLVELHGGEVSVESRGEGQGATFTVMLPVAGERHAPPGAPQPSASPPHA